METAQRADDIPAYHIWGIDSTSYGPVELPPLVNWIKDERVIADTWIYVELAQEWLKAADVPELKMFFKPKRNGSPIQSPGPARHVDVEPGALRRIKVLAEMAEEHLATLSSFVQLDSVRPCTHVIRKGSPGDALFGVLEGELRSCIVVDGIECPLATLGPGSIFGEISVFDKGPHAVDVISNQESLVIKIAAQDIERLSQQAPDAGLALLSGLIKSIAGRVRTLTKRYEHSVQIGQNTEELRAVELQAAQ